jgi:hypothetical protein
MKHPITYSIEYFIESDKRFNFCQILTHNIIFNVFFLLTKIFKKYYLHLVNS